MSVEIVVAACSGTIGAALSLIAACNRYIHRLIVVLVLIIAAAPALSQVPGKEPGWWLDEKGDKKPDPKPDKPAETKPAPKVKIIERKIEHKTIVVVHKPAVIRHIHHIKPHHKRGHWHRCRGLFGIRYWCWKR